jgi:hypothetical protein
LPIRIRRACSTRQCPTRRTRAEAPSRRRRDRPAIR